MLAKKAVEFRDSGNNLTISQIVIKCKRFVHTTQSLRPAPGIARRRLIILSCLVLPKRQHACRGKELSLSFLMVKLRLSQ